MTQLRTLTSDPAAHPDPMGQRTRGAGVRPQPDPGEGEEQAGPPSIRALLATGCQPGFRQLATCGTRRARPTVSAAFKMTFSAASA